MTPTVIEVPISEAHPVLAQTAKHPKMSDRYNLINTAEIIGAFGEHSWVPREIKEIKTRTPGDSGFQKHCVRFKEVNQTSLLKVDDIFPEIVLINSHNGASAFSAQIGLFRLVCSNGLTVAKSTLAAFKCSHLKSTNLVKQGIEEVFEKLPFLKYNIEQMQDTTLSTEKQLVFAHDAVVLKGLEVDSVDLPRLLTSNRTEPNENSLWTVFNTVQEKFTQGGNYKINFKNHIVRSRGVRNITQNLQLNNELWELAVKYIN